MGLDRSLHAPIQDRAALGHQFESLLILHNAGHPHWSESVDWRDGRWDPVSNGPWRGSPILHVRVRDAEGKIYEPVHWACGDGDGMIPPFVGWFVPDGYGGFNGIPDPVEWQPLRAKPEASS